MLPLNFPATSSSGSLQCPTLIERVAPVDQNQFFYRFLNFLPYQFLYFQADKFFFFHVTRESNSMRLFEDEM